MPYNLLCEWKTIFAHFDSTNSLILSQPHTLNENMMFYHPDNFHEHLPGCYETIPIISFESGNDHEDTILDQGVNVTFCHFAPIPSHTMWFLWHYHFRHHSFIVSESFPFPILSTPICTISLIHWHPLLPATRPVPSSKPPLCISFIVSIFYVHLFVFYLHLFVLISIFVHFFPLT